MSNTDWYQTEGWYSPLQPQKPETEKPKKKRKKLRRWIIALSCTLGVVGLIWASSVIAARLTPDASEVPGQFSDNIYPEDYRKFFSQYYTSTATDTVEITMERAEVPIDYSFPEVERPEDAREYTLQELYKRCSDSIVGIYAYKGSNIDNYSWGSGVIISEGGLIVTNTHIIEGCSSARIRLADDTVYDAKLVGADGISDIAVLKIDGHDLPAAIIGDSGSLTVGDHVAAIGNPLGEDYRLTLTDGIISATGRGINYNGHAITLIQTNTALNGGNSGGALFNMYGEVIGITNMKKISYYSTIEGMSFAIPTSTVKTVVSGLLTYGKVVGRTSIGLTLGPVNAAAGEYYQLPEGLYVSAVSKGSDAAVKGIQVGDIVTKINGEPVTTTAQVVAIKDALNVGDEIVMDVWRDGESFQVSIKLMDTNDVYK